ncbi:MAG: hypothetical protein K1X44_06840 [Alphaproteobacteria bacterium]|nr:hypothetical protein [Alphaproteobacteria bacterium]
MRDRMKIIGNLSLIFALVLGLYGCSQDDEEQAEPLAGCPTALVIKQASHLVHYDEGQDKDPTDVNFKVRIGDIDGVCEFKDREAIITMAIRFFTEKGPANKDQQATFTYFVAIVDPSRHIIDRQSLDLQIPFKEDKQFSGMEEELEQRLQIPEGVDPSLYKIYVGLQISDEEFQQAIQNVQ